ncbi:uncharacterized protein EI90DRAFT_2993534 [Cantharellus anzutake]|uniref:uncharacterized protein n=1 Tax=Cantharellus anzutake TaxID=1750568 RepID=UPI0019035CEC|nr:uncharacterized protein EI90DRAFT_2993534 [Cantharellus anzutake]KAF8334622.1 hypothetical protein EI90DRAFT_2993534 [Cantharellus anzutake]
MPPKKRKISDLTANDVNALSLTLNEFQMALVEDDEDLPPGLITALEQFREKLQVVKHVSFSKVDSFVLLQVNIKSGPLFLVPEKKALAEELGSAEIGDRALSMKVLKELIELVRKHVSVTTEAGCRVLINLVLLRVASAMSTDQMDVNIIPEYPIPKTLFLGNHSFGGVVDFLMTKLPERYTSFLLDDPVTALGNPTAIDGPVTSNIFEAKRDNVRAAIPPAVIAAASHCSQHGISVLRGCITSGEQWVFFVYSATSGGGGSVSCSNQYEIGPQYEGLPLILGLLHDWVDNAENLQQVYFTSK